MKRLFYLTLVCLTYVSAIAQVDSTKVVENNKRKTVLSAPIKALLQDGIVIFQNKEKNYKFMFDVRVQADAAAFFGAPQFCTKELDGKSNPNHIGNGISLRRTRLAVKAQLGKNWSGKLETDWTSGTPELKDAYIAFTGVKGLDLRVGNFKENFSIQNNTSSLDLMFMERPMIVTLAPSHHLGFNAQYAWNWLWASAGVFGPELGGAEEHDALQTGNEKWGYNEGLSYTGKVVFRPIVNSENSSLHIGGAFSYREPKLIAADENGFSGRFSSRNTTAINRKKYLDTDDVKGLDLEIAWTVELAGHWKQLRYEVAYIARGMYIDPAKNPDITRPQWGEGWYVQASWLLFGGSQKYDVKGARYTRATSTRKWGNLEVALRYEYADFNTGKLFSNRVEDTDIFGGSAHAYSVGLNYYPTKNVKIMLNYQFNDNDKYANGKGSYYIGYDSNEAPTKDPIKVVTGKNKPIGVDYHMLALRFQVAF